MSTRYNNGSHYENLQRPGELQDMAAHAHRLASEHHYKQGHQTLGRRALSRMRPGMEPIHRLQRALVAPMRVPKTKVNFRKVDSESSEGQLTRFLQ